MKKYLSHIGVRIIKLIILFAIVITLITTGVQLYIYYLSGIKQIKEDHANIIKTHEAALSYSLWVIDNQQLNILLTGILEKSNISRVALYTEGRLLIEKKKSNKSDFIVTETTLVYPHRGKDVVIGKLILASSRDKLMAELWQRMINKLLTNGLEYLLLIFLFVFIFYHYVGKHLKHFVNYLQTQAENQTFEPYRLQRKQRRNSPPDELNEVVDAFNSVNSKLFESLEKLKADELALIEYKDHLENQVAEQTASLKKEVEERKASEAALIKRENELQTILKTMNEGFLQLDENTTIVAVNRTLCEILGQTESQLIGTVSLELFDPANRSIHQNELALRKKGISSVYEVSITSADGRRVACLFNATPILDSSGRFKGSFAMVTDITERKRVERQLRIHSEAIVQSGNTIVITDSDGVIEYVNPTFTRITGFAPEEAIGQNPRIIKSDRHEKPFYEEMWQTISSGRTWRGELANRKKNGDLFWEQSTISPIKDSDGNITNYIAIKTDITLRKEMDESLRQAKLAAEEASLAKSRFLANMSHELRTPLNSIIGFSHVLKTQVKKALSNKQAQYFDIIAESGNHLLDMVNDILDLAKIEAGKTEIQKKPFDLGMMLEKMPNFVKSLALKKKIRIRTSIQPNLGWVNGDETRLKQVVFNLLSNAIKFTDSGKEIGIEAVHEGDRFTVTVWDQGIGIPNEDLEKVFDPFEQARHNRATSEQGTGLGLSISRRLLDLHGGNLTVTSAVNQGSRFIITLPGRIELRSNDKSEDAGSLQPPDNQNGRLRILLTEDNPNNIKLIEAVLADHTIDVAQTGEEAVSMASSKSYDLILMDIQLPGIDGTEAMRRIRDNSGKHVLIYALTAFAMKGDTERYLDAGFDDYISKPLQVETFLEKIQSIVVTTA